ncbi:prolactin-inducible protein [Microcebus murinus]|uniref:prolactin-inducible protein n=1 Tax=Microcebus murinus TaxID=30608 RepID=UPI003F6C15BE
MRSLQLLFRASTGLLLVLCLQLGTIKTQEDTTRRAVIMNVDMPSRTRVNQEVSVKLNIETELTECLVYYRNRHLQAPNHPCPRSVPSIFFLSSLSLPFTVPRLTPVLALLPPFPHQCKAYLRSNVTMDGPFNYRFTVCVCKDAPRTLYWDFQVDKTMGIAVVVDTVRELGICPDDMAVIPIKANRYYYTTSLVVQ